MKVAVYPGSFDPITFGHLDVLRRASDVFDRVVVGVLENPRKQPLIGLDDRIRIIGAAVREQLPEAARRIDVEGFRGLTVHFARRHEAGFIVRGMRAVSDFETELQVGHANRKLAPEIDTVFFMTSIEHGYVSSSLVREIAQFGGPIEDLVPKAAAEILVARYGPNPSATGGVT